MLIELSERSIYSSSKDGEDGPPLSPRIQSSPPWRWLPGGLRTAPVSGQAGVTLRKQVTWVCEIYVFQKMIKLV